MDIMKVEVQTKNFTKKPRIPRLFYLCKIIKKRPPKVPSSDLNHFNFNNIVLSLKSIGICK
ncbi:hypothetical protein BwiPL1_56990 (plasmid) [Bacillus wiedmannii]|nr:hypothetical protein BwiPL1_56990 [Bacillus wiedmannii]